VQESSLGGKASAVKAVIFDMGGTLKKPFKKSKSIKPGVNRIIELLNLKGEPAYYEEKLLERYYAYRKWTRETLNELNEREIWTKWLLPEEPKRKVASLALELNEALKLSLGSSELRDDAAAVIKELYRRGYKLGIVSNSFSSTGTPKLLKEYGLYEYFSSIVLSSSFGTRKPDPSMLLKAAADMDIMPAETAYVGDKIDRDVIAAEKAGFKLTIYIKNPGKPVQDPQYPNIKPDFIIIELSELLSIF